MASDAGWGAFMTNLIKTGQVPTYIKSAIAFRTDEVHPAIKTLGKRYYVSESDELFEGVSFGWGKHRLPDEGLFSFSFPYIISLLFYFIGYSLLFPLVADVYLR